MARISDRDIIPDNRIMMFDITLRSLQNNTIVYDYFKLCKKILEEGYELIFIGEVKNTPIPINNIAHLKNHFKMFANVKDL